MPRRALKCSSGACVFSGKQYGGIVGSARSGKTDEKASRGLGGLATFNFRPQGRNEKLQFSREPGGRRG